MAMQAKATIVDGVRQKPVPETQDFTTNTEAYLYNVGAGKFFSQGNAWGTQASLDNEGRKVKFAATGNGDYTLSDYCTNYNGDWAWRYVFYDSETQMYVDRTNQSNYFFNIVDNGDGTFRLTSSDYDDDFDLYAYTYFVGIKSNTYSTALEPFLKASDGYVDWALVTVANHDAFAEAITIYEKAQELKAWIDKITAENGDASSIESVYLDESSSLSAIQSAIASAQPLYITALINNATDKENVDVTLALVNPDFEQGETGWTVEATPGTGSNGRAGNVRPGGSSSNQCYEAWNNSNFDIYQTLADMPVGVYQIEVQGFYRYLRDNNAWNAYLAQNVDYVKPEGVPVYVYLNNNATNFVNIYGDSQQITSSSFYSVGSSDYASQTNGGTTYYFPNGMASAAIAFSAGMYTQSAFGLIANEGDTFRIGVKGNSSQGGDSWVIWDNFKLYYRGFKAEVVQPVLESAMADLNQYANLLMGKTEYANLTAALTAAQEAIDEQNGEAMFQALNSLYNVKESVIASKDLFLAEGVADEVANLQTAITEAAEKKLYKANVTAAETLVSNINGCTVYEGSQIEQLKSDVANAISAINNSQTLYSRLNTAMESLTAVMGSKATQSIIDEASALQTEAQTQYDEGTIADTDVSAKITSINEMIDAINASAALYTSLYSAIGRLESAIGEASDAEAHVSATTLERANLRLTQTQKQYNEGSIADANIESRINVIDQLIESLTTSLRLYENFADGLADLNTILTNAAEKNANAGVREFAQTLYDTNLEAYNNGTIIDEDIEAEITKMEVAGLDLNNSVTAYATLAEAIPALETAVTKKAAQSYLDDAATLLTEVQTAYTEGTIADNDIEGKITEMEAVETNIETSAALYAQLAAAIGRLEDGIAEASAAEAHVSATTLERANLRLAQTQKQYNEGSIADANIESRITVIDQLIESLTYSLHLYEDFNTALASLGTTLNNMAETKMNAIVRENAQRVFDADTEAYNNGTINDENIETEISNINDVIATLSTSATAYATLAEAIPALEAAVTKKATQSYLDDAATLLTEVQTAYAEGTIADSDIEGKIAEMEAVEANIETSAARYAQLTAAIAAATAARKESMEGDAIFQIPASAGETLASAISTAQAVYDNSDATPDEVNAAVTAIAEAQEAYEATELNAPAESKYYNITVATEGHAKEGNAIIIMPGDETNNNPTGYGLNCNYEVNTNYAQAVTFTKVSGNTYNISFQTTEGVTYLTYGTLNGSKSGQAASLIQATTDESKKGEFLIQATKTSGAFNIINTITNTSVDCQSGGNIFTEGGNTGFAIAEASQATAPMTITDAGWATFIAPFAVAVPEGITAYTVTAVDGESLKIEKVSTISANTPVLLNGDEYNETQHGWGLASADTYTEGLLTGVYYSEPQTVPGGCYGLQKDEKGNAVFNKVSDENTEGVTIAANRAYIAVESEARTLYINGKETAINNLDATTAMEDLLNGATIYDMNGRKVNGSLQKGKVYIVNGKKIFVQ